MKLIDEIFQINIPDDIQEIFSLRGYTSVITGGASGFGEAIAIGLARFGSNIVLLDINSEQLERVRARVLASGVECKTHLMDVTDWESVSRARDQVQAEFNRINVLVNCAGINIRKHAEVLSSEEYKKVIDVNLTGTFNSCKAFSELMKDGVGGSIINMASINGHIAMEKQIAYASSKGGILQLTKVLAVELSKYGIRVNALSPAHHKTPLVAEMVRDKDWYEEIVSNIPMGRFGEAYEIVGPTVFLASKASSFITGISLLTDGGWTAV